MAPPKKHDSLEPLIKQRNLAKANIERIRDFVLNSPTLLSTEELDCRLEIVETYFTQALEYQSSIEEHNNPAENAVNVRGELEDLYCSVKVQIRTQMKKNMALKEEKGATTSSSKGFENLPKLKLPTFSGKYSDFHNFIHLFKTLVHDEPRLSTIEKFNHLSSCLSGPALRTIKALEFTEENYHTALKLLENRFDNKYLMCQDHIRELFRLTKVQKGSAEQLRCLVDVISVHFNALSSMLSFEEMANAFVVHLAMVALDSDSQDKVDESIDCSKAFNWSDCLKVLTQRCQMLESREPKTSGGEQNQLRSKKQQYDKSSKAFALPAVNNFCSCCEQSSYHPLWKCSKFLELSPEQRFVQAKKLSLCINCLSPQHSVRHCKSSGCKKCKALHHTLLHRNNVATNNNLRSASNQQQISSSQPPQWHESIPFVPSGAINSQQQLASQNHPSAAATTMVGQQVQRFANLEADNCQTILATALVEIQDKYGNKQIARALLDSASQLNFITQNCAQRLNLEKTKVATVIGGIGQAQTQAKFATTASINSRTTDFKTSLQFLILPAITGYQPNCKINANFFNIPQDLTLADPQFHVPQKIDLLIGADLFFELFNGQQIKLGENCPTLMHTVFGWIVSGKCKTPQRAHTFVSNLILIEPEKHLDELVNDFWSMEKVPDAKFKWSKEQEECEAHFINTVKRLDSGRYELRLPFKTAPTVLGDSKQMAVRRLHSIEKRLSTDPKLKQAYTDFLTEYEADGHMTKIDFPASLSGYYIMPHHCVLRPDKTTTKCRVVFDASAKAANNIALNDILKVGPVVQNDLVTILWKFRLHKYGIMADVVAMYRQIFINPDDCKVQNILWRNERTDDVNLYRLNTVTYGTASAPYLATRCLVHLADASIKQNPKAAGIIKNDFYVDDLISGGSSLEEIQTIKQDVSEIMAQAGFTLHKWFSNHNDFLVDLSAEEREKMIKMNHTNVVKTLGVIWDSASDTFKFNYNLNEDDTGVITKRKVLSDMSRLFDPLGLIKPITVKAKIFLQELWLKKLSWDEPIPEDCSQAWIRFLQQLANLNHIKIPRYVLLSNARVELHGFADASTRAYGCCFFVRCVDANGNCKVSLLTSRSKVAPISTVRSLPCLELCGAHLMIQLFLKVRTITNFHDFIFWSDSIIVLLWLAEHATNLNTFVANRVSFIQEHTAGLQWRYVPSGSNPADLVSRGTTVDELSASIWFTGPAFLAKSIEHWPQNPKQHNVESLPERKAIKTVLLATHNDILDFVNSRSNFIKICTTIAYVRRFICNCRNKAARSNSTSIVITASEMSDAFSNIVVIIQQVHYSAELSLLNRGSYVHQRSSLKALNPFIEQEGDFKLLKVGGRLKNAALPYVTKCPTVLPKNCPFVTTYVRHLHHHNCHAGAQALLSLIQQKFWIVGAREYARKVVKQCVLCFKYRPKMMAQIMGNLPEHRVSPVKPFTHCGVDFCGPIVTTTRVRGKPKYKSYIAVFVCFVTRAVHLEVVSALSTDAFIAALKRFIGRRGLCTTLYCDNATNFVGARNQLHELRKEFTSETFQRKLTSWCAAEQIEFKHIPPRSPHFGGMWEAAVKSAKTLLYKLMQAAVFTFEELTTAVVQIEGILNSRPLTAMSADPNDERVLTPAHFLNQSRAECIAEPTSSFEKISLLKTWQQITSIQQHFWRRWSKEYLLLLQQRQKWTKEKPNLCVGALVMVHDDNTPPQKWVIGRVINVVPGADGHIRVADVKTTGGTLRRAITKLAAIPVEPSD